MFSNSKMDSAPPTRQPSPAPPPFPAPPVSLNLLDPIYWLPFKDISLVRTQEMTPLFSNDLI